MNYFKKPNLGWKIIYLSFRKLATKSKKVLTFTYLHSPCPAIPLSAILKKILVPPRTRVPDLPTLKTINSAAFFSEDFRRFSGVSRNFQAFSGFFRDFQEFSGVFIGFPGVFRHFQAFQGFSGISKGFQVFSGIFKGFHGFSGVLGWF